MALRQQCKLLMHNDLEWWRRRESNSKAGDFGNWLTARSFWA
jgi:hypothetical protein